MVGEYRFFEGEWVEESESVSFFDGEFCEVWDDGGGPDSDEYGKRLDIEDFA